MPGDLDAGPFIGPDLRQDEIAEFDWDIGLHRHYDAVFVVDEIGDFFDHLCHMPILGLPKAQPSADIVGDLRDGLFNDHLLEMA